MSVISEVWKYFGNQWSTFFYHLLISRKSNESIRKVLTLHKNQQIKEIVDKFAHPVLVIWLIPPMVLKATPGISDELAKSKLMFGSKLTVSTN